MKSFCPLEQSIITQQKEKNTFLTYFYLFDINIVCVFDLSS